ETAQARRHVERRSQAPVQKSEPEHQRSDPRTEQEQDRDGTVYGEKILAEAAGPLPLTERAIRQPGRTVEPAGEPQPSRDAPGQNHRFERIPQDERDQKKSNHEAEDAHTTDQ